MTDKKICKYDKGETDTLKEECTNDDNDCLNCILHRMYKELAWIRYFMEV